MGWKGVAGCSFRLMHSSACGRCSLSKKSFCSLLPTPTPYTLKACRNMGSSMVRPFARWDVDSLWGGVHEMFHKTKPHTLIYMNQLSRNL